MIYQILAFVGFLIGFISTLGFNWVLTKHRFQKRNVKILRQQIDNILHENGVLEWKYREGYVNGLRFAIANILGDEREL